MTRKPIAIRRKDYSRVLLTELLPYELPVFFSNHRLYGFHSSHHKSVPQLVKKILGIDVPHKYTIPFSYKIERGDGRQRTLSVMHPSAQLQFIDFYATWDAYILNQCSKSEFSLRHPVHVGSVYFEPDLKDEDPLLGDDTGDLAPSSGEDQRTHASTYFYYARYNQIWKFYDSTEFRRIEQDFRSLLRLDISKCFQSIYTHSISWAVRSKAFAKKNKNATSFDKAFDTLMQSANWSETNGILVGPEVSRIFAEVILQQLDADIKADLINEAILPGKVCIRRYVDDYLIFYSSEDAASRTKLIIERVLERYKLSLNDSKTETIHSPLISNLTIARESIRTLLHDRISRLFNWHSADEDDDSKPSKDMFLSQRSADLLIRSIKGCIKAHGASYSTIVPYGLGFISKSLHRALRKLTKEAIEAQDAHRIYMILSYVIEVAFFLYRMDVRVNTTYKIASILVAAKEMADKFGSAGGIIRQEIVDHGSSVLRQARQASIGDCEISSLLTCLFFIGGKTAIPPSDLLRALRLDGTSERVGYFQIATALYCAQDKKEYKGVLTTACQEAQKLFSSADDDMHLQAEATLLYLDLLSCPFVDDSLKNEITQMMAASAGIKSLAPDEVNHIHNFVGKNLGFCDWDLSDKLPLLLGRKELKPAYD